MLAEIPAARFGGTKEIASMAAFLASPAATCVNELLFLSTVTEQVP